MRSSSRRKSWTFEPTAALDLVSEYEIYSCFSSIPGDKTAIYISHRLAFCRFCDKILVFDSGQILQRGTHDSLIAHTWENTLRCDRLRLSPVHRFPPASKSHGRQTRDYSWRQDCRAPRGCPSALPWLQNIP